MRSIACSSSNPMRRWRDWQCAHSDLFVTPSVRSFRPAPSDRVLEIEWGADTDRFRPAAAGPAPFARPPGRWSQSSPARSAHGTARSISSSAVARTARARRQRHQRGLDWRRGRNGRPFARPRRDDGHSSPARCRTRRMPAALAASTSASRRSTSPRIAPLALDFYWSPLKISSTWRRACRSSRPRFRALPALSKTAARGALRRRQPGRARATLLALHRDPGLGQPWSGRTRTRRRTTAGGRTANGSPVRFVPVRIAGVTPRILIATDSFPPNCGGSGWSTWELARGLRARGHAIARDPAASWHIRHPIPRVRRFHDRRVRRRRTRQSRSSATTSRTSGCSRRSRRICSSGLTRVVHIVHAQHVLTASPRSPLPGRPTCRSWSRCETTGPSAIGRRLSWIPPIDALCPGCSTAGMRRCLQGRVGPLWPWPLR